MKHIELYESFEFSKEIEDSMKNYKETEAKHKKVMARQIARTALGYYRNSGLSIDKWLEAFKDEPPVLDELNKIKKED